MDDASYQARDSLKWAAQRHPDRLGRRFSKVPERQEAVDDGGVSVLAEAAHRGSIGTVARSPPRPLPSVAAVVEVSLRGETHPPGCGPDSDTERYEPDVAAVE